MHRVVTIMLILATPMIPGAADSSYAFTDLHNEISAEEPATAGSIEQLLAQHPDGDVGLDVLVRRYVNDKSIEETVRGTLLNMLYVEVRESGQMDAATTAAVVDFARSADSYFIVSTASKMLEASGTDVPLSMRIKQAEFQWILLDVVGLLSLAVGAAAGLYVLVLVALPGRKSRLRGAQRATGFALWLLLSALFIGAILLSVLHSLGHNSMPAPDKALPYYAATLAISISQLILAIALRRSSHLIQQAL